MSGFDPGEGWRKIGYDSNPQNALMEYRDGVPVNYWVREAPVPPLPTAEDTLIRVTWKDTGLKVRFALDKHGTWQPVGLTMPYRPEELHKRITGFKVLAEPVTGPRLVNGHPNDEMQDRDDEWFKKGEALGRRETAKAVIDRVRQMPLGYRPHDVAAVIKELFGVSESKEES